MTGLPKTPPSGELQYYADAWRDGWTQAVVREACDSHMRGEFSASASLIDAMLKDARVYAAVLQRLGPPLSLVMSVRPSQWWNGKGISDAARLEGEALFSDASVNVPFGTIATSFLRFAIAGFSIMQQWWEPNPSGTRLMPFVRAWPLHATIYREEEKVPFRAILRNGEEVPIVHGDGRWIVVTARGDHPHRMGALRALANAWADRANMIYDRGQNATAHGSPNVVGTLPKGIVPESKEGTEFKTEIRRLQRPRSGVVVPWGSKVDLIEASTVAATVFDLAIKSDNSDIAMSLLGQDGTSSAAGGNYTKTWALQNVRYDIVESDVRSHGAALTGGILRPYSHYNFGNADAAGVLQWNMPDPEEGQRVLELAQRHEMFVKTVRDYASIGLDVDLGRLSAQYRIDVPADISKGANVQPVVAPAVPGEKR